MTTAIFQSFNPEARGWDGTLAFGEPESVQAASTLAGVPGVLAAAEAAGRAGQWAAVFIAYEAAAAFDPAFRTHPPEPGLPLAWCAIFAQPEPADAGHRTPDTEMADHPSPFTAWTPAVAGEEYAAAIRRIRDYIAAGDSYQVNYTFPLHSTLRGDPLAAFHALGVAQGAGYSAYLNLGSHQLLCFSPELFFKRERETSGDGVLPSPDWWRLTMQPMKGTMARGRFPAEDLARMRELAACGKNRAENLMILDMLRNDVSRLALPGSVRVPRMFEVERYRTVHQMTSTVEAVLRPGSGLPEIFAALFPCASITGAPKIRAMQIIRELEAHHRGAYTGAIGLVRPGGAATFNVAIRTIELRGQAPQRCLSPEFDDHGEQRGIDKPQSGGNVVPAVIPPPHSSCLTAVFGVGGGITWDSTAAGEYDECRLKAAFLSGTAADSATFDLLEALLLEEGEWFLLERHLERMRASADYFARPFPELEIRAALAQLRRAHPAGSWKARLRLDAAGALHSEAQPLPAPKQSGGSVLHPPETPGLWRVALAVTAVDARDIFLFHKTTRRGVYAAARAAQPAAADVVLWNERGELTESGVANLVLELGGELVTPPVACGLLAGVFRQELLAAGVLRERVLYREDLARADAIWLINSVRRWIRAELPPPNPPDDGPLKTRA